MFSELMLDLHVEEIKLSIPRFTLLMWGHK